MAFLLQMLMERCCTWHTLSESVQVVDNSSLKQLAEQYNAAHGTSLSIRGRNVLILPTDMIQAFFKPVIAKCLHHVKELLDVRERDLTV